MGCVWNYNHFMDYILVWHRLHQSNGVILCWFYMLMSLLFEISRKYFRLEKRPKSVWGFALLVMKSCIWSRRTVIAIFNKSPGSLFILTSLCAWVMLIKCTQVQSGYLIKSTQWWKLILLKVSWQIVKFLGKK